MKNITDDEKTSVIEHREMLNYFKSLFSDRLVYNDLSVDRICDILYDTFYYDFKKSDSKDYDCFWDFLKGNEISKDEYKNIRSVYLNRELKINTKNLKEEEIKQLALNKLVNRILLFEHNLENKNFVNDIIEELLVSTTVKKYYYAPSENVFTDQYKEKLKFWGKSDIIKSNELKQGYTYSYEYEELENKPLKNPSIDYNKVITSSFQNILLITDEGLHDPFTTNDVVSNFEVFPVHGSNESYVMMFDYDNYNCSYGVIGDLCLEVDVTIYLGNEMWEFYLVQAYKSYNSNNFRTAFLLGFVSFESLIETIIFHLKEKLKIFIKELYYSYHDANNVDVIQFFLNEIELDFSNYSFENNLQWYIRIYNGLCNDQRDLINDKLRDIIRLYIQLEFCSDGNFGKVEDFSKKLGNECSLESLILNKMNKLAKIRNNLAHGSENDYCDDDYKIFFEELIILFAHMVSYLKGEKFLEIIAGFDQLL